MTKEEIKKYNREYYLKNKKKFIEKAKIWNEENNEKRKLICKKWVENNQEYTSKYRNENKQKIHEYNIQYNKTKIGRANKLVTAYRHSDKMYERGECTISGKWIVEKIFSQPCHYCGESDWTKLGCDRIDNSKPHTENNVVCCCAKCNEKRMHKEYNIFLSEMDK